MGFMDKAKQLAEQAQQKVDEVQKQFNEGQQAKAGQAAGPVVEYDKNGRPIGESAPPPPAPAPAPVGGTDLAGVDPLTADAPPAPAPEAAAPPEPVAPPAPVAPPKPPSGEPSAPAGDENAAPKLSSGDPLG
jgi:hypothetical protein